MIETLSDVRLLFPFLQQNKPFILGSAVVGDSMGPLTLHVAQKAYFCVYVYLNCACMCVPKGPFYCSEVVQMIS